MGLLLTGLSTFDRELEKLKDEVIEREKKLRQPQTEPVKPEIQPQSTRYVNEACCVVSHGAYLLTSLGIAQQFLTKNFRELWFAVA